MKNIILPNRYGYKIELINLGSDDYYLSVPKDMSCRIIGEINDIQAIDPPGGPMISIGDVIEGRKVLKINNNILTLSREISN